MKEWLHSFRISQFSRRKKIVENEWILNHSSVRENWLDNQNQVSCQRKSWKPEATVHTLTLARIFHVQCKRTMLLLMLPNWIIYEWRRINTKTCANIQSLCLPPPIAFCHFTNSSAKILVILIFDAVVLFMALHFENVQTHTDRFWWTVIRICRRTSETVNFDAIFECENSANANRVAVAKLRENFTLNICCSYAIWLRCEQTKWINRNDDLVDEVDGKVLFGIRWHNKSVKLFRVSTEVNITFAKSKHRFHTPASPHIPNCHTSNRGDINAVCHLLYFASSTSFVEHFIRTRSIDLVKESENVNIIRVISRILDVHRKGVFSWMQSSIAWFIAIVSNCCWSKREWSNQLQTTHRKWNQRNEFRIALALYKKKLRKYSCVRESLTAVVIKYQSRSPTGKLIPFFILMKGMYRRVWN